MSFVYHEPETLEEVTELLAEHGPDARLLGGGTAFLLMYRLGLLRPTVLVGLQRVETLRVVEPRSDGLFIGAHTTLREIERSTVAAAHAPVLRDAFRRIATVRIRNQATIGGNLCHADPAQDPPPVLIALGAVVHLAGPDGRRRTLPAESFFIDYFTPDVGADEALVGVTIPPQPMETVSVYMRFLPRSSDDYPTVSVAASIRADDAGVVRHARVALGGVGATPIRAAAVEEALGGEPLSAPLIHEAAQLVEAEVDPLDDGRGSARYKRDMAVVWVRRALGHVAAGMAEGREE